MSEKNIKEKNKKIISKKTKSNILQTIFITLIVFIFLIIIFSVYFVFFASRPTYQLNKLQEINKQITETTEISSEVSETEITEESSSVKSNILEMKKSDVYNGHLLLIDSEHEYKYSEKTDNLVKVKPYKLESYQIVDNTVALRYEAIEAFNNLMNSYTDAILSYKDSYLKPMIRYGYRTEAAQNSLYKSGDSPFKPRFSENHTGYAIDLAFYDGHFQPYDAKDDFEWINNNCYKYGIIVSFKDSKSDITKVDGMVHHFRFVGIPHSYAIEENNFCMSEYLEFLKNYSIDNPYTITVNNEVYQIYYSPFKNMAESSSTLRIPTDFQYSVSGNNYDGFIVTIKGKYTEGVL